MDGELSGIRSWKLHMGKVRIAIKSLLSELTVCRRSVHNTRIERLWRDVTASVGKYWKLKFELLEREHGLDINNRSHVWLLHHLYLNAINQDLMEFAERWNAHILRLSDSANRSPRDLFYFDMFTRGFRGDPLPPRGLPIPLSAGEDPHPLSNDEISWFGLEGEVPVEHDGERVRPWMGNSGPSSNGRSVHVDSPEAPLLVEDVVSLLETVGGIYGKRGADDVVLAWRRGLAFALLRAPEVF